MNEINLLHDSRVAIWDVSRVKKVLLLTSFYSCICGIGVFGGMFLGKNFLSKPRVVAAEDNVKAAFTDTYPMAMPELQGHREEDLQQSESIVLNISQDPIKLFFQTKQEHIEQTFSPEVLKSFLTTSVWGSQALVVINNSNFDKAISELTQRIDRKSKIELVSGVVESEDRVLDEVKLKQILRDEFWGRKDGREPKTEFDITLLVSEKPGSDGSLAEKYLEVDISQQKLYRWEGGEMAGRHVISTGKYGPTPIGIHKIKNKARLAWSPPAQCWTPFWMAFDYNPNLQAYLGFHELPYWDGANGTRIRRPFDTLGVPVTGGCIQLNIGDAEEVYNWSEVGMRVLIHE